MANNIVHEHEDPRPSDDDDDDDDDDNMRVFGSYRQIKIPPGITFAFCIKPVLSSGWLHSGERN